MGFDSSYTLFGHAPSMEGVMKFPKTFVGFCIACIAVCAVIALFKDQFGALADFLMNPKAPEIPDSVPIPGRE